jgi:hypothetical protein
LVFMRLYTSDKTVVGVFGAFFVRRFTDISRSRNLDDSTVKNAAAASEYWISRNWYGMYICTLQEEPIVNKCTYSSR